MRATSRLSWCTRRKSRLGQPDKSLVSRGGPRYVNGGAIDTPLIVNFFHVYFPIKFSFDTP